MNLVRIERFPGRALMSVSSIAQQDRQDMDLLTVRSPYLTTFCPIDSSNAADRISSNVSGCHPTSPLLRTPWGILLSNNMRDTAFSIIVT
jgi:hypothetical protein